MGKKISWTVSYHSYNQSAYREEREDTLALSLAASSCAFSYRVTEALEETAEEQVTPPPFEIKLLPTAGYSIQPGSVLFRYQGALYIDRLGKLYRNPDPATGIGTEAGDIDYSSGVCTIVAAGDGNPDIEIISLVARMGKQLSSSLRFRTPGAPIRPGSINFVGAMADGEKIALSVDFDGQITGAGGKGQVDFETGVVAIDFGQWVADSPEFATEPWYNADEVENGQIFKPLGALAETMLYGCVVYSYIPLDADLIGLDPVRLPPDGRVPIVRRGDVVVVHNAQPETLPGSIAAGGTVTLERVPDSIDVYDSAVPPLRVSPNLYERRGAELTFAEGFSLSAFTPPLVVNNRIEDMVLVSDADITGRVTVASGLAHDYPVENTFISSALLFGDLQARLYGLFDQRTWQNRWSDALQGDGCIASYNEISFPPVVTNSGAVTERWALIFDSSEHFKIVGESYGVVGDGYITQDCAPINGATGKPYFTIKYGGFGQGWAAGNVIRFNTEGASPSFWVARTTLQGPATEPEDQFTIQLRGDAE